MSFSYKTYEKELARRTKELRIAYQKGDLFKTICYLKYISAFYYRINYKMTDDELEEITYGVAHKLLGETVLEDCNENTVLFYDSFGQMTRGLANIYVNALGNLGFHVIWVLYDYLPDVTEIQNNFCGVDNVEFRVIPKQTIIDRMKDLQRIICDKMPRHIFVYTTPEDIAGIGVMSTVKGDVDRYLIDLTDHAFWVGKCAVDWVIGFRNYGYNVAVQHRRIAPETIIILPYYPDSRENYPFEGMPFDTEEYDFIFSGGSPYKIEGDTAYKEIVQYILEKYPKMKFVYAGNGTNQTLDDLECEFQDQFFHIKERKDLDAILKCAKLYLSTYPIIGGLMIQFALQNRCIPLSLCMEENSMMDVKTFILNADENNFIFYQKESLLSELDHLLQDEGYYAESKRHLSDHVISEVEFEQELKRLLSEKRTKFPGKLERIEIQNFLEVYKENATYELFCELVYNSRNKWVYRKHPIIVWREKRKQNRNKNS